MADDPFRGLTPEEAEAAYAEAEATPLSDERIRRMCRTVLVRTGIVPVADMTDDELWDFFCYHLCRFRVAGRTP